MIVKGKLVDIHKREIRPSEITIENGIITNISEIEDGNMRYILPPLVDAHIHIESSMLVPSEFARIAVLHGTVATVSDPHEIANVCGLKGVRFMIDNGKQTPFKFYFGASPCVPATNFETAGAQLSPEDIDELLSMDEIKYLAEVMNYPGVLAEDADMMKKIQIAKSKGKVIDGHAPGLTGDDALNYISKGITTDHECYSYDEALFKVQNGMKIIIREGSAAKNFDALIPLLKDFPDQIMFCSDDKHPDDLIKGHIDELIKRALDLGHDLYDTLRVASLNPVMHYGLDVGLLREGDKADFIMTNSPDSFDEISTYIDGICVADRGRSLLKSHDIQHINNFNLIENYQPEDFPFPGSGESNIIEAHDGELITSAVKLDVKDETWALQNDILRITVVNRYSASKPAIGLIKNFGLKSGAIASSVAHDSHNIICVGTSEKSITEAVNLIIDRKGGISVADDGLSEVLPLPIAGLMSLDNGESVSSRYTELDLLAKSLGSTLSAPFMTLSFMALLVIPELKLSDKGLFDVKRFQLI